MTQKTPLANVHEWISFVAQDADGDARTYLLDLTFLESNYTCIFGNGCQGILDTPQPELSHGCCSHGAHFVDDDDLEEVTGHVARLTPDIWQFQDKADRSGWKTKNEDGDTVTRRINGACIFLNRPDFEKGAGCALHLLALEEGANPTMYKPDVCWQVPIRREDEVSPDGSVVTKIAQWDRTHWGEGGHEFHWWCMEDEKAFVGAEPVYRGFFGELTEMMGPAAYAQMVEFLDARRASGSVSLPHPTLRKEKPVLPKPGVVSEEDTDDE